MTIMVRIRPATEPARLVVALAILALGPVLLLALLGVLV